MKKVEQGSIIEIALNACATYQFGDSTNVTVWWREDSPHGTSYRGFNYDTNRWLQLDLDFALRGDHDNTQTA